MTRGGESESDMLTLKTVRGETSGEEVQEVCLCWSFGDGGKVE